jgi:hypothetical protein
VAKTRIKEDGLLTHGQIAYLLSAPSHPIGTVALVADFVADYSCEGSGGIAPLFPLPLAHRVIKELQRARSTLQSFIHPTKSSFSRAFAQRM